MAASATTEPVPAARPAGPSRVRRVAAWWRARPALGAAVVYLLLSLVFIGPGLFPDRSLNSADGLYTAIPWAAEKPAGVKGLGANFEIADQATQFDPMLRFTRERGEVPLWNSHLMGGRPFLGNAQSAVFSPFSAPSYVLPFWNSFGWAAVLKLWIAAFGTYLLGRALGMRFGGALLAGVVFAFGTFFVVWLAWPLTSIFCFIPWLLLVTELLIRRPGPLPAAGLAALTCVQFFGGHPESNFHVMFAVCVWFAFRALWHWRRDASRRWRQLLGPTLWFAGALALGAGLAMIALAPFLELLFNSGDLSRRLGNQEASHWPRRYLGALFLHDYWGRPTQTAIDAFMSNRGWYAGGLTLMLSAAALIIRPTVTRVAFVVFAVFCACLVVGVPPILDIVVKLPGFKTSHNERMLIFVLLGLAMLAGWGLDDLTSGETLTRTKRRLVLGAAAVLALVPIVWMGTAGTLSGHNLGEALKIAWLFQHPAQLAFPPTAENAVTTATIRMSALFIWLPIAALAVGLIVWRLRPRHALAAGTFVALAVLLVTGDLFRANMGFNPAIKKELATQPDTPAIQYLQSRRPRRYVGLGTELFTQPMPADTAMNHGLYDARGYDYPVEKRFDKLWRRSVAPTVPDFTQPVAFAERTPAAIDALSLLSVSDLMVGPNEPPLRRPGLRVGYRGPDAVVYANDRALPRVFLVDGQRTVGDDPAALAAVTAPGFDGRRVAITQRPVAGVPQRTAPGPAPGSARLVSYADERVVMESTAPKRSLLVLTDVSYPGWKATLDGKPVDIERVDYLLRGVPVPPGRHRVEMRYEPASWRAGWITSLVCLVVLLGLVAAGIRRRGRQS